MELLVNKNWFQLPQQKLALAQCLAELLGKERHFEPYSTGYPLQTINEKTDAVVLDSGNNYFLSFKGGQTVCLSYRYQHKEHLAKEELFAIKLAEHHIARPLAPIKLEISFDPKNPISGVTYRAISPEP